MSDFFVLEPPGELLQERVLCLRTGMTLIRALGRAGIWFSTRTIRKYVTEDFLVTVKSRDFWAIRLAKKLTFVRNMRWQPSSCLELAIQLGAVSPKFRRALSTVIKLSKRRESKIREFVEAYARQKGVS